MFFTQLFQLVKYYVFLMELTQAVLQKGAEGRRVTHPH